MKYSSLFALIFLTFFEKGNAAPDLTLESVAPEITIRSGDRADFPFQIRNTVGEERAWTARVLDENGGSASLEDALAAFVDNGPAILATLPERSLFEGGVSGTQIEEGSEAANSPFRGGNILSTDLGGPLEYSDQVVTSSPELGPQGRYFSFKLPGLFLFGGDFDGPETFTVTSLLTSNAEATRRHFDFTHGGRNWRAFVSSRNGSSRPSVNELFLIDTTFARVNAPDFNPRQLSLQFSGKRRIFFATFATPLRVDTDQAWFEALTARMMKLLPASPLGTTVNPASGSLAAGAVGDADLAVDAFGMIPGIYNLQLSVEPPVDGAEAMTVPFILRVEEPAIRLSATKIERSGILGMGSPDTVALATESTTGGFFESWTARLIDADPSMSLQNASGFVGDPVIVRFDPNQATRSEDFRTLLEIEYVESGTARYQVELSYAVGSLEVVKMAPDPTRPVVYALSRTRFEGIGNLVVVDPYSGELLKTIRIGGRPSDLAISPDGQAIYVINSAEMTISQIDPIDLELVRTVAVPGEKWRSVSSDDPATLEAGNNGRIYYTDTSRGAPLRVLDFESASVIETLEPFNQPGDPTFSRYGELFLDPIAEKLFFAGAGSNQRVMIGALDIADEGLSPASVQAADANVNFLDNFPEIHADLNGDQFFLDRYVFPRPGMPGSDPLADNTIIDISAYGDLAVSRDGVFDVRNGQQLATLPGNVFHAVFSPDQTGLLLYRFIGPTRFSFFPLPEEIRPPSVAIRPEPSDGGFLDV